MFGLLIVVVLCSGDGSDEVNEILRGGALLLLFLSPVLLLNSSGWPRGGLFTLLFPVKLLDNGVDDNLLIGLLDDIFGDGNLFGVDGLLGVGGEDILLAVEVFGCMTFANGGHCTTLSAHNKLIFRYLGIRT